MWTVALPGAGHATGGRCQGVITGTFALWPCTANTGTGFGAGIAGPRELPVAIPPGGSAIPASIGTAIAAQTALAAARRLPPSRRGFPGRRGIQDMPDADAERCLLAIAEAFQAGTGQG